jgi:hypothetical protein
VFGAEEDTIESWIGSCNNVGEAAFNESIFPACASRSTSEGSRSSPVIAVVFSKQQRLRNMALSTILDCSVLQASDNMRLRQFVYCSAINAFVGLKSGISLIV